MAGQIAEVGGEKGKHLYGETTLWGLHTCLLPSLPRRQIEAQAHRPSLWISSGHEGSSLEMLGAYWEVEPCLISGVCYS